MKPTVTVLGVLIGVFFASVDSSGVNCTCGWRNKREVKLIGGYMAQSNAWPMIAGVALKKPADDEIGLVVHCSGTIITPRHILTASHCFDSSHKLAEIGIHVGTMEKKAISRCVLYDIEKVDKHQTDDIGLVTIYGDLTINGQIGPACLPTEKDLDFEGYPVHVLGWPDKIAVKAESTLREFAGDVTNRCSKPSSNTFCTSSSEDNCNVLSGGPVLWTDPFSNSLVLLGVKTSVCTPQEATYFNIVRYLDWIQLKISEAKDEAVKTCAPKFM